MQLHRSSCCVKDGSKFGHLTPKGKMSNFMFYILGSETIQSINVLDDGDTPITTLPLNPTFDAVTIGDATAYYYTGAQIPDIDGCYYLEIVTDNNTYYKDFFETACNDCNLGAIRARNCCDIDGVPYSQMPTFFNEIYFDSTNCKTRSLKRYVPTTQTNDDGSEETTSKAYYREITLEFAPVHYEWVESIGHIACLDTIYFYDASGDYCKIDRIEYSENPIQYGRHCCKYRLEITLFTEVITNSCCDEITGFDFAPPFSGCATSCVPPTALSVQAGILNAQITWDGSPDATSYQVQKDGGAWVTASSPYLLGGLIECTECTVCIRAVCDGFFSPSICETFTTLFSNCGEPDNVMIQSITTDSAIITFEPAGTGNVIDTTAILYCLDDSTNIIQNDSLTGVGVINWNLTGLEQCKQYRYILKTNCDGCDEMSDIISGSFTTECCDLQWVANVLQGDCDNFSVLNFDVIGAVGVVNAEITDSTNTIAYTGTGVSQSLQLDQGNYSICIEDDNCKINRNFSMPNVCIVDPCECDIQINYSFDSDCNEEGLRPITISFTTTGVTGTIEVAINGTTYPAHNPNTPIIAFVDPNDITLSVITYDTSNPSCTDLLVVNIPVCTECEISYVIEQSGCDEDDNVTVTLTATVTNPPNGCPSPYLVDMYVNGSVIGTVAGGTPITQSYLGGTLIKDIELVLQCDNSCRTGLFDVSVIGCPCGLEIKEISHFCNDFTGMADVTIPVTDVCGDDFLLTITNTDTNTVITNVAADDTILIDGCRSIVTIVPQNTNILIEVCCQSDPNCCASKNYYTECPCLCSVSIQDITAVCDANGDILVSVDVDYSGCEDLRVSIFGFPQIIPIANATGLSTYTQLIDEQFAGDTITITANENIAQTTCLDSDTFVLPLCDLSCFEADYSAQSQGMVSVTGILTSLGSITFSSPVLIFDANSGGISASGLALLESETIAELVAQGFDASVLATATGLNTFAPIIGLNGFTLNVLIENADNTPISLIFDSTVTTPSNFTLTTCPVIDPCTPCQTSDNGDGVTTTQVVSTGSSPFPNCNGSLSFIIPINSSCNLTWHLATITLTTVNIIAQSGDSNVTETTLANGDLFIQVTNLCPSSEIAPADYAVGTEVDTNCGFTYVTSGLFNIPSISPCEISISVIRDGCDTITNEWYLGMLMASNISTLPPSSSGNYRIDICEAGTTNILWTSGITPYPTPVSGIASEPVYMFPDTSTFGGVVDIKITDLNNGGNSTGCTDIITGFNPNCPPS